MMKDWVSPFKETAAHVKVTVSLLWEMLFQGLQGWDAVIVCLGLNLGLGFFFLGKSFSLIFMKCLKEQYISISQELRIRGMV